ESGDHALEMAVLVLQLVDADPQARGLAFAVGVDVVADGHRLFLGRGVVDGTVGNWFCANWRTTNLSMLSTFGLSFCLPFRLHPLAARRRDGVARLSAPLLAFLLPDRPHPPPLL